MKLAEIGDAWNRRYDTDIYQYGEEPNVFLTSVAEGIPTGGRVLCIGDGEGRNGVWLAKQGFEVVSLDASYVASMKAERLAVRAGVTLETRTATLPDPALEGEQFDAVVSIFVHTPPAIRTDVHAQVARVLAPGGVLLLEGYTPEHLELPGKGGPPVAALMFTEDQLRQDFAGLEVLRLERARVNLDEGALHQGESEVIRLVARRPA